MRHGDAGRKERRTEGQMQKKNLRGIKRSNENEQNRIIIKKRRGAWEVAENRGDISRQTGIIKSPTISADKADWISQHTGSLSG